MGEPHGKMTRAAHKEGRGAPRHGDEGPGQLMKAAKPGSDRPERGQDGDVNLRELIHKGHQPGKEAPRRVGPGIRRRPVVRREGVPLRADVVPTGVVPEALPIESRREPIDGVRTGQTPQAQKQIAPESLILQIGLVGEGIRRGVDVRGDPPRLEHNPCGVQNVEQRP